MGPVIAHPQAEGAFGLGYFGGRMDISVPHAGYFASASRLCTVTTNGIQASPDSRFKWPRNRSRSIAFARRVDQNLDEGPLDRGVFSKSSLAFFAAIVVDFSSFTMFFGVCRFTGTDNFDKSVPYCKLNHVSHPFCPAGLRHTIIDSNARPSSAVSRN